MDRHEVEVHKSKKRERKGERGEEKESGINIQLS